MSDTKEASPVKLPLAKRVLLALRGGIGSGMNAMLSVLAVVLVLMIGVGGFISGLAIATKRNKAAEQNLLAQVRSARSESDKLSEEKQQLEKKLDDAKVQIEAQATDMRLLREDQIRLRLEREALEKVLATIQQSLGNSPKGKELEKARGAMLKFSNRECELEGGAVRDKKDVACLNLKEAIEAMNAGSKPSASDKPAPSPSEPPKPGGH
ncbi:hypothetical protein [Chitinimonas lacunae]|uniref:DUF3552 domain-containing protein n=1 Tax=Chitinimonas lacunae TaxID=1963018 RepID=A0ABV8MNV3_9NEIS